MVTQSSNVNKTNFFAIGYYSLLTCALYMGALYMGATKQEQPIEIIENYWYKYVSK